MLKQMKKMQEDMKKNNWRCRCIRCREVKGNYNEREKIYLFRKDYQASGALEIFLSFENKEKNSNRLFRSREHVLGAIINAKPLYVGMPTFNYFDNNYSEFRDSKHNSRQAMIYAAANDGMLHAFNADNGKEEWAFIPSAVLPNLVHMPIINFQIISTTYSMVHL